MPTTTQLGAIKSLFHALELHDFSDSEIVEPGEAFLIVQARFRALKDHTCAVLESLPHLRNKYLREFEFVDLVLGRVRTFLAMERPLAMQDMLSATSAIQFLSRKLIELHDLPDSVLEFPVEELFERDLEAVS